MPRILNPADAGLMGSQDLSSTTPCALTGRCDTERPRPRSWCPDGRLAGMRGRWPVDKWTARLRRPDHFPTGPTTTRAILSYRAIDQQPDPDHEAKADGELTFQVDHPVGAGHRLDLRQALDLVGVQTPILPAPSVVGDLAHTDLTDRIRHAATLRYQDIDLAQLRDDVFGLVSLLRHEGPPACSSTTPGWTTSGGVNQLWP